MSEWSNILNGRIGFEAAVWIVTWAAVLMLALIAANLHARLRSLEAANLSERKQSAYRRLIGGRLQGIDDDDASPRLWLLLSSNCSSCLTIIESLETVSWRLPITVAWTGKSDDRPRLPNDVRVIEDGGEVAKRLNVQVTPFAFYVGAGGFIERAFPVSSIEPILQLANERGGVALTSAGSGGH